MSPIFSPFRVRIRRFHRLTHGHFWFPHVPLAILLSFGGFLLLKSSFGRHWQRYVGSLVQGQFNIPLSLLPALLIGGGMVTIALGLLWRSRLAWAMAVLLAATATVNATFTREPEFLLAYFAIVLALLIILWRHFDRSSVAAGTLFALTSVVMLLLYATFGSFYLGKEFHPRITNLVTALYFSMVTMSTVGFGDIIPETTEARLFTISIIALGVAVFATSLTAVIVPVVGSSFQRILTRRGTAMKRENHFVVIGNTPLAVNTWHELAKRGLPVTRVLREALEEGESRDCDVVVGDPSMTEVLREAGAQHAQAVLAMMDDDSENAFVVLAVKELAGSARTLASVNDARHLSRIRLAQPDVLIAPQVLGGELTAMLLSGEQVTPDFVMQRVFQESASVLGEDGKPKPGRN